MSYKQAKDGAIIRLADGTFIPADPANRDYRDYLEWLNAGNTPTPADPPPPPAPDWVGFLADLRTTSVFGALRGQARVDVAANALATELRITLGEAALGLAEVEEIQSLLDQLKPTTPAQLLAEVQEAIEAHGVPLSAVVG